VVFELHALITYTKLLELKLLQVNYNFAPLVAELKRVAHEVDDHLDEAALVAVDVVEVLLLFIRQWLELKRDILIFSDMLDLAKYFFDGLLHREELFVELERAVFHLRQVQQVQHQGVHDF
jgi:hypothetical protein